MSDELPFRITLDHMIAEVALEVQFRERTFGRRIADASLALQNQLRHRIEIMRAVKRYLEERKAIEG